MPKNQQAEGEEMRSILWFLCLVFVTPFVGVMAVTGWVTILALTLNWGAATKFINGLEREWSEQLRRVRG
jgi:hypothetical protein